MNRYLFASKAFEEIEEVGQDDLADMESDVVASDQDIAMENADIDHALDVVDGITDVATIVSEGDGELSPTEMNLVRANMNMAVAGSNTDASDIIPGLESHMTRSQLVKAIEEQQYTVLQRIQQGIAVLFKKLRNGWRNVISIFKSEARLLRETASKLGALRDFQAEVKVKWPILVLSDTGKASSESEIYSNVRDQMQLQQEGLNTGAGAAAEAVNAYMSVMSTKFSDSALQRAIAGYKNFADDLVNVYSLKSTGADRDVKYMESQYFTCAGTISVTIPKSDSTPPNVSCNTGRPINVSTDAVTMTITASELSKEIVAAAKALERAGNSYDAGYSRYDVLDRVDAVASSDGKGYGNMVKNIAELASSGLRISKDFIMDTSDVMDFSFWAIHHMAKHLRKIGQQVLNKA